MMLSLPPSVRVFVATQPVDGRKGVDSLVAMVRSVFSHDPLICSALQYVAEPGRWSEGDAGLCRS
jgi:hypothetical protein